MAGAFQSSAFQNSAFQTDAVAAAVVSQMGGSSGLRRKRKYGDDLTYEDWQRISEWRDKLADMKAQAKAPAVIAKGITKIAREVVEVPPDVWTPPQTGASALQVAQGIDALLNYLAQIDAVTERVRLEMAREAEEDDEIAAILLLQ